VTIMQHAYGNEILSPVYEEKLLCRNLEKLWCHR
jgi:hypothetical protein